MDRERNGSDLGPKMAQRSWELFSDVAPVDIADVVLTLIDDATPLTSELEACATTLVHGDVKPDNIGFDGGRGTSPPIRGGVHVRDPARTGHDHLAEAGSDQLGHPQPPELE